MSNVIQGKKDYLLFLFVYLTKKNLEKTTQPAYLKEALLQFFAQNGNNPFLLKMC